MLVDRRVSATCLIIASVTVSACSGSENISTQAPPTDSASTVPELGAATEASPLSAFKELDLRAHREHFVTSGPARIDTDIAGLSLSVLLDGPLMPAPAPNGQTSHTSTVGLGALEYLPPFRDELGRATWPALQTLLNEPEVCDSGSSSVLLEEPPASRPVLTLRYAACTVGEMQLDGTILIERPSNALQQPTRVGYDALELTIGNTHRRLTGTLAWEGGDDCNIGERRIATILSTNLMSGIGVLLDEFESYTTQASVLGDCDDARIPNGWRGRISFGSFGVVSIDTPVALSHDWRSLPRGAGDEVLLGGYVPADGRVRVRGDTSNLQATQASITFDSASEEFPGSPHDIAVSVRMHITSSTDTDIRFMASPAAVRAGALTQLGDRDNDGLPDSWELYRGLDPDDATDAAIDEDSDGSSNLTDYQTLRY